jgi:hypothetical protein
MRRDFVSRGEGLKCAPPWNTRIITMLIPSIVFPYVTLNIHDMKTRVWIEASGGLLRIMQTYQGSVPSPNFFEKVHAIRLSVM